MKLITINAYKYTELSCRVREKIKQEVIAQFSEQEYHYAMIDGAIQSQEKFDEWYADHIARVLFLSSGEPILAASQA